MSWRERVCIQCLKISHAVLLSPPLGHIGSLNRHRSRVLSRMAGNKKAKPSHQQSASLSLALALSFSRFGIADDNRAVFNIQDNRYNEILCVCVCVRVFKCVCVQNIRPCLFWVERQLYMTMCVLGKSCMEMGNSHTHTQYMCTWVLHYHIFCQQSVATLLNCTLSATSKTRGEAAWALLS